jgi:hypothetical protein
MAAEKAIMTMNDSREQPDFCRHCGGPKLGSQFVCHDCWKLLPQWLKRSFVIQKMRVFSWLREFAPQRNPTSTPHSER